MKDGRKYIVNLTHEKLMTGSWIPALDHLILDGTLKDDYVSMILGRVLTEKTEEPEKMISTFTENLSTTITNQKSKNPDTVKFSKRLCIIMHDTINTLETEGTLPAPINLDLAINSALDLTSIEVPNDIQSIENITSENSEKYIENFLNRFPKTATLIGVNPIKPTEAGKKFILSLFTHLINSNFINNGIINPLYEHINHDLTHLVEISGRTKSELNQAINIGLSSHITNQEETLSLFTSTHIDSYQKPETLSDIDQQKQTMFHHCLISNLIKENEKTIEEIKETSETGSYEELKAGIAEIKKIEKKLHKTLISKLQLMEISIATSIIQTLPAPKKKVILSDIAIDSNLELAVSLIKTNLSSLKDLSQIDYITQTYRDEKKQSIKKEILQLFTKNPIIMDEISAAELSFLKTELDIPYISVGDLTDIEEYLVTEYQNETPIKEIIEGINPNQLLQSICSVQILINEGVILDEVLETYVTELKNHKNKLIDLMTSTPENFYGLLEMLESGELPTLIPNAFSQLYNIKQDCDLLAEAKLKIARDYKTLSSDEIHYVQLSVIKDNGELDENRFNYILSGIDDIDTRNLLKIDIITKIDLSVISKAKSPADPKLNICLNRFLDAISKNIGFLEESIGGETNKKKAREAIRRLYGISIDLQNTESIETAQTEIKKLLAPIQSSDSNSEHSTITLVSSNSVQKETLNFFNVALENNMVLVEQAKNELLTPNHDEVPNVIEFLNKLSAITHPDNTQITLDS
ncbi:hypothetical protein HOG98_07525 [bacterium]|jgi:hypothetical protein|nr:hypothetical protein [bacterium]